MSESSIFDTPAALVGMAARTARKRIAAADDTTTNQFFVAAIAEKISAMETADFFQKRAALGSPQSAQSAWDKVGASAALPEDQWAQIADDPSWAFVGRCLGLAGMVRRWTDRSWTSPLVRRAPVPRCDRR